MRSKLTRPLTTPATGGGATTVDVGAAGQLRVAALLLGACGIERATRAAGADATGSGAEELPPPPPPPPQAPSADTIAIRASDRNPRCPCLALRFTAITRSIHSSRRAHIALVMRFR